MEETRQKRRKIKYKIDSELRTSGGNIKNETIVNEVDERSYNFAKKMIRKYCKNSDVNSISLSYLNYIITNAIYTAFVIETVLSTPKLKIETNFSNKDGVWNVDANAISKEFDKFFTKIIKEYSDKSENNSFSIDDIIIILLNSLFTYGNITIVLNTEEELNDTK